MRAVICCCGELEVADLPAPEPGTGQIVLDVARAGICGSDLHLRTSLDQMASAASGAGGSGFGTSDVQVVFGHEFSGEVGDYGPDTNRRWTPGTLMVAMPVCRHGRHPHVIGTSPQAPGAFAEQVVVQESTAFAVPNGLPAEHAALTEPMSVAWHAVQRSQIRRGQTAYVTGCGPIGLAMIAMLKAKGVETVVASDFSPRRRQLAESCGADVVVDPKLTDPFTARTAFSDAMPVAARKECCFSEYLPLLYDPCGSISGGNRVAQAKQPHVTGAFSISALEATERRFGALKIVSAKYPAARMSKVELTTPSMVFQVGKARAQGSWRSRIGMTRSRRSPSFWTPSVSRPAGAGFHGPLRRNPRCISTRRPVRLPRISRGPDPDSHWMARSNICCIG